MREQIVENWAAFVRFAERCEIGDAKRVAYVFRGQENAEWSLTPSLHRAVTCDGARPLPDAAELLRTERYLLSRFRSTAPNHLSAALLAYTNSMFEWWTLMRHYGVPTRVLDWTTSLYVAAYFACSHAPNKDAAIYVVHAASLRKAMENSHGETERLMVPYNDDSWTSPDSAPVVALYKRESALLDRMVMQQGLFMACHNVAGNIEQILAEKVPGAITPDTLSLMRLVVPAALKPGFLRHLHSMNVAAHSLFPGLDGIGRQLDEAIRYY